MNKKERLKIADVIRNGIPYLWDGVERHSEKAEFVCFAISRVKIAANGSGAARAMIASRLYPYNTVERWLKKEHGITKITYRKLQAYRKAWMESMVEEFSK